MEKLNFLFSFLFLLNIYSIKNDYVTFDIKTYKNNSNVKEEYLNFYYNNLKNMIYSEIPLGPNKEKYVMEIKDDQFGLTIYNHNCDIPPIDNSKSSTYLPTLANSTIIDFIDDNETIINGEYFTYILENKINVKTNTSEIDTKIDYLYSPRNNSNYTKKVTFRPYTCFNLGFNITLFSPSQDVEKIDDFALNLVFQFKKNKVISSYDWFIQYDPKNNDQGKLVLGATPHEYRPDKFKEENMRVIKARIKDNNIRWEVDMDEIYIQIDPNTKELIKGYPTCSFEPTLGVIIGPVEYKLKIEEFIFNQLTKEEKCFKELVFEKYFMYYCKKEMKDTLKNNKYTNIYFKHRYFSKIFELNFDDLFVENGDYIYLRVFIDKVKNDIWRFGKPFLQKYFFSYNLDGRTISLYDEPVENKENGEKGGNVVVMIIIIVLIIIFGVLGFILGKHIYSNRKKRQASELLENDNYDYGNINVNENN